MILSDWFWSKLKKKLKPDEQASIIDARISYQHCPAGYLIDEEILAPYLVTLINSYKKLPIKDL